MRHFIYTYSEKAPRRDTGAGVEKTVIVYRVIRNRPQRVAKLTHCYVSEFQLLMMALEYAKALPRRAFARHQFGSYEYGNASALRDAGIADVHAI